MLSWSLVDTHRVAKNFSQSTHTFPAEDEQGDAPSFMFQLFSGNKCPLHGLFSVLFFFLHFYAFVLVILLLNMVCEQSAEVLSSVSKQNKL